MTELDWPIIRELLYSTRARLDNWREVKAVMARRHAPDFTLFDFVRSKEVGLSALLRWMLDPRGSHGQGADFLRAFAVRFATDDRISWLDRLCTPEANSMTEAFTRSIANKARRMDVLVEASGHAVAIENKPWAGWQANQLRDYLEDLGGRAPSGHCLVVFSGRSEEEPPADAIAPELRERAVAAGLLRLFCYSDLVEWVRDCAGACQAVRPRLLLEDFADFIDRRFCGKSDVEDNRMIIEPLLDNSRLLEPALRLIDAGDALYDGLWDRLEKQLASEMETFGWKVSGGDQSALFSKNDYKLLIEAGLPEDLLIGLGYSASEEGPFIGVCRMEPGRRRGDDGVVALLNAACAESVDSDEYWPWWYWFEATEFEARDEDITPFWVGIGTGGRTARPILNAARKIADALAPRKAVRKDK